jgi:hypothetical protein
VNRTLWTIAIFGFISVMSLVIAFLLVFKSFGESPYSSGAKVAVAVRDEFHLDAAASAILHEAQKTVLVVQYQTHADSKFNLAAQNQEMQGVAVFAAGKLEPAERRKVDEVRVRRTEIHGSGCMQRSYVTDLAIPNPLRNADPLGLPPK